MHLVIFLLTISMPNNFNNCLTVYNDIKLTYTEKIYYSLFRKKNNKIKDSTFTLIV